MRLWTGNRRRADRCRAGWIARYRTGPEVGWHECQVLDVSETGAGLELRGSVMLGGKLVLDLRVDDNMPDGILLRATVRNWSPSPGGTVRVGVEFASSTPLEQSVLAMLLQREAGVAAP